MIFSSILIIGLTLGWNTSFDKVPRTELRPVYPMKVTPPRPESLHIFDVIHYTIDINIDTLNHTISGNVVIKSVSKSDTLKTIDFDLTDSLTVDEVRMNANPLVFTHSNNMINIDLGTTFIYGDTFEIEIAYRGSPPTIKQERWETGFFFKPGVCYTLSVPYGARLWFPCYDEPYDKATLDMIATVPLGLVVASNGILIDTTFTDSTATYHWQEKYPIATYLISLAISDYAIFSVHDDLNDIDILYFVYPEDSATAAYEFANLIDMLDFYTLHFSSYPFLKYGMAEAPVFGGWGAMEHQTCTTVGDALLSGDRRYEYVYAHELAHQWWGDFVSIKDFREMWLKEGPANYCEALYIEHKRGDKPFKDWMDWFAELYFDEDLSIRFPIYDPPAGYLVSSTVYEKGAWVLHMLRHVVGEGNFWLIFQNYADFYGYKNATISDFKDVCELVTGEDLDWFFDEWIYKAGYPEYEYGWDALQITPTFWWLTITIDQVQTIDEITPVFRMPIDIRINFDGGYKDIVVINDKEHAEYRYPVSSCPTGIEFDPGNWILKKATQVGIEEVTTRTGNRFELSQSYPNPFSNTTTINYTIPKDTHVRLAVYDVTGRLVRSLVDHSEQAGIHSICWDGKDDQGRKAPSGVYLYKLKLDNLVFTQKVILIKR